MNQPQNYKAPSQKNNISDDNPLKSYFRSYSMWVPLPSKEMGFYPEQIMEVNEDGEMGIMPMTGQDEIILKNPDALLNGEAMRHVLKSCCPTIKDPDHLLLNDVEALMVGIRIASYGKEMEMEPTCPECGAKNTVSLDLEGVLQGMSYLDADHSVVIENSDGSVLRVHFVPYMYKSYLKMQKQTFEEEKIMRGLERMVERGEDVDDTLRLHKMSESYDRITQLNFQITSECVNKITSETDENFEVTNQKHILEFMSNISRQNAKKVSDGLDGIAEVGVRKKYDATCEKCGHEWEERIAFEPSSFF